MFMVTYSWWYTYGAMLLLHTYDCMLMQLALILLTSGSL